MKEKKLRNLSGKYSKEILRRLEQQDLNNKRIRKVVLDCLSDLGREIEDILKEK